MARFYKFFRDIMGFLGILRDFKGQMFCYSNGASRHYRPFHSPFTPLLLLFYSLSLSLLPSCDVGDYIGDRFGRWQITSIQTPDTLASPRDLFFDFQAGVHIAHILHEADHRTTDLHGLARQEGDSLFIRYLPMDKTGQSMRDDLTRRFLIDDDYSDVRFRILQLDGSRMILSRGERRWELRSY